jgi:hypothetical protein
MAGAFELIDRAEAAAEGEHLAVECRGAKFGLGEVG